MQVVGQAPDDLLFLDRDGAELSRSPGTANTARQFVTRVTNEATLAGNEEVTFPELPRRAKTRWWPRHAHLFTWNERRKVLEFSAGCPKATLPPGQEEPDESSGTRPATLDELIGQERAVGALKTVVRSAQRRGTSVNHILFCGPPGLGKTTLAHAVAREMGRRSFTTSGAALTDAIALVALLAQMSEGDVLFLDEIHALPRKIAEMLYEAMEDRRVSLPVVCGTETRTLTLELEPMTVIGATTDPDRMPPPLLARFITRQEMRFYSEDELVRIVKRSVKQEGFTIDREAAHALARASHGTPREALAQFCRARDETVSRARQVIGLAEVRAGFAAADLDERGLGPVHRQALSVLRARQRPLGVSRLSAHLGIPKRTFRKIYEPALMRLGLVSVTSRGLVAV